MRFREWLGVGEQRWKKAPDEEVRPAKTLWDWLQLLIVPAILVAVTFAWSGLQTRSDNRREDQRIDADRAAAARARQADRATAEEAREDATLQAYLDQMSGLMLHEKLLSSKKGEPVRAVARTVTLATLRRLDGQRKGEVVRFLFEAKLLEGQAPLVVLRGADLAGASLEGVNLKGAHIRGTDLRFADLRYASLDEADIGFANLRGANLLGASLSYSDFADGGAYLRNADLRDANLRNADLAFADLAYAKLMRADLSRAALGGANFIGADLRGANLSDADLSSDLRLAGSNRSLPRGLDLDRFITDLPSRQQKTFLDSHKGFLGALSRKHLARFNLTPEKLAKFRRDAGAA